jgi:cytochrome c biogenesis protein CcmG/thiol:disulfide interchange protein DsbE
MAKNNVDRAILALIGLLVVALVLIIRNSTDEHVVEAGEKAPEFDLTTDRGQKITPANFGGKILVLNFWATWCAPCIEEVPSLDQFQQTFKNQGVVVLGVSIDKNATAYQKFLGRFNVSFQTVRDANADVSTEYGTFKVPETYIIDRGGNVVRKVIGPLNWTGEDITNYVRSLL